MTVAFHAGEDWSVADGAPAGVRFDITVPSASNPERPYRIVRQEASHGRDGYIIHTPACRAWRSGHRMCGHVIRALETSEEPLRRLAIDIREAWSLVGLCGDDKVREFAGAMVQSAEQALNMADELERYEERQGAPRATMAEAVATFDRGPIGAAR